MKAWVELMMKDRKVQVLALLLTALLLANAGFYLLRTKPVQAKASALEETLQENRRAIKAKQDEYRQYASFGRGQAQLETFRKMLPAKTEYTEILRKIFKMAKEDGVKSNSIASEKREAAYQGDVVQINFAIPVSGSYKDVRKFISDMENSSIFLNIDNLGFVSNQETGEVSVTLGISTYARS